MLFPPTFIRARGNILDLPGNVSEPREFVDERPLPRKSQQRPSPEVRPENIKQEQVGIGKIDHGW